MNRLHYTPRLPGNRLHFGEPAESGATLHAAGLGALPPYRVFAALSMTMTAAGLGAIRALRVEAPLSVHLRLVAGFRTEWAAQQWFITRRRAPLPPLIPTHRCIAASWAPPVGLVRRIASMWFAAQPIARAAGTGWPLLLPCQQATAHEWPLLTSHSAAFATAWQELLPSTVGAGADWPSFVLHTIQTRVEWSAYAYLDRLLRAPWHGLRALRKSWRDDLFFLVRPSWRWPRGERPPIPPPPKPPKPSLNVLFFSGDNTPNTLHFGIRPKYPRPPHVTTIAATHGVTVRHLPSETPLTWSALDIKADRTTWTDQITLTLHRFSDITLLFDDVAAPQVIEVVIDGYATHAVALTYSESRQWGQTSYRVSAYSWTALLAAPYADKASYRESSIKTAHQIADTILAPFDGWTLDWQLVDWLIPANTFSYSTLAPVEAIALLAKAVGGTLQPHPTEKILRVLPLHPVSPWLLALETPTMILGDEHIFTQEASSSIRPGYAAYDGVHVAGQENGGIMALVRLEGSPGAHQIAMVTDAMITHVDAARERGRAELALRWPMPEASLRIPIMAFPDTPALIYPGDIIEVRTAGIYWRGQVMSRSLAIGYTSGVITARQSVSFSSGNAWDAWRSIEPEKPLISGTVEDLGETRVTVRLADNSVIDAIRAGDEEIGQRVFIRGDVIAGKAPTLPYFVLDTPA